MNPIILDVREPNEFSGSHVSGAVNIPLGDILSGNADIFEKPKDTPLIVYCRSGARASSAVSALEHKGFTNLTNGINQNHIESNM